MRQVELAGPRTGLAPLLFPLAVGCVFQDSRVPVAICDKEVSVWREGDVSGSVEPVAGVRLITHSDRDELFTQSRILGDDGRSSIHGPYIPCGIDADAVWNLVVSLAPRAQELPLPVQNQHWVGFLATLYFVDGPLGVNGYPGNESRFPALGGRLDG